MSFLFVEPQQNGSDARSFAHSLKMAGAALEDGGHRQEDRLNDRERKAQPALGAGAPET